MVKLTKNDLERRTFNTSSVHMGSSNLGELVDQYGRDAWIEAVSDYDYAGAEIMINISRMETDDEYNDRLEKTLAMKKQDVLDRKKEREKRLRQERSEYERLKKKFEPDQS